MQPSLVGDLFVSFCQGALVRGGHILLRISNWQIVGYLLIFAPGAWPAGGTCLRGLICSLNL